MTEFVLVGGWFSPDAESATSLSVVEVGDQIFLSAGVVWCLSYGWEIQQLVESETNQLTTKQSKVFIRVIMAVQLNILVEHTHTHTHTHHCADNAFPAFHGTVL